MHFFGGIIMDSSTFVHHPKNLDEMNQKYRFQTFSMCMFLLPTFMSCKDNSVKDKVLKPFEITFRISPNLYCTRKSYTITEKSIRIVADVRKPDVTDEEGYTRPDCGSALVFEEKLPKSEALIHLSSIEPDDLEAISHEGCEGGVSHAVTLKKNGKTKQIVYTGCAKRFDPETKSIVKFINSRVPAKYHVDL